MDIRVISLTTIGSMNDSDKKTAIERIKRSLAAKTADGKEMLSRLKKDLKISDQPAQ